VRLQEDRLLERMEEAETDAAELKAAEAALKTGEVEAAQERTKLDAEEVTTEAELARIGAARSAVPVSPAAIGLFEHVSRHRKGLAMSEARDGHCTQCHVRLRPQVYNEVRRNEQLIQCESCSRILYFVPAPAADVTAPASPQQ
jgi:uncharacterized protein